MSDPQNTPEGGASPEHGYPSVNQPVQPQQPSSDQAPPQQPPSDQSPQPPSFQPPPYQPASFQPPPYQPASFQPPPYQPASYQPASYQPPDQPWAPASGSPGVGSAPVYEPTQQLPPGAPVGNAAMPPYGSPMSGLPSDPPFDPSRLGPQPPARRRWATPVLAVLAVLLLLAGGVMTALFVTKNSQLNDAKRDVASRDAQIKDLEIQLQKVKDDLSAARQDLNGSQNAQKETQRQKEVISRCLTLLGDLGRAAQRNDTAEANKIAKDADKACAEAQKYLD